MKLILILSISMFLTFIQFSIGDVSCKFSNCKVKMRGIEQPYTKTKVRQHQEPVPFLVQTIPVKTYMDQKAGTSGLRKKTRAFIEGTYMANFIQSYFSSFPDGYFEGSTLLIAGDGRYFTTRAIQIASEIAAAHGVRKIWTGIDGLCSTPAASAIIREREGGVSIGGIILTASHNPGGIDADFGVKFNDENGSPVLESVTSKIFEISKNITIIKKVSLPRISLSHKGIQELILGKFSVEVIDTIEDWMDLQRNIFDFGMIRSFVQRKDFKMVFDAMHGVAGPYAHSLFVDELGLPPETIIHPNPKKDFGKLHPDPNLTYAKELVEIMKIFNPEEITANTPDFGAAADGDCDRNMILGKGFFVTPSDSLAIITSYATKVIPFFSDGIVGVSRSMPTSCALNAVANKMGIPCYEVPTGWKFFGNLMEAGMINICGEESFGTGSNHIREKDGLWAVLAWLSILAYNNQDPNQPLVSVRDIVTDFWRIYGRNYYTRFDYEDLTNDQASNFLSHIQSYVNNPEEFQEIIKPFGLKLKLAESFTYVDPVDKSITSNQGIIFNFSNDSRIIFRKSGTGSSGDTIRIYIERPITDQSKLEMNTTDALSDLIKIVNSHIKLTELTGREEPTVIT
ncbi:phosphoglucomutase/phosphomannomutase, C-terminal domain-containing protein [Cryptosporidium muris RN66]|uniref:phosphoglucomutase (alpha-D-glucose-1,6-bisphosphate-dependent) n=1 Tax=Cryptosporidium muris (strain RN66) TaxID=441375 RepID=B6AJW0_CRYMR|nr:phosphoglucomutase/phosphomannomutase, C-terminal domain-containing protein [Cryptosporidium muris RN66]EEA08501.1 phosphoglucomutase/phosphomannomutase, C-terminal domain-containing protein [Cryptosporidium muris RN66]|eukprot:XP_002142850.1 phosphoglucomutase/phosphomannomutase, C-terminal domain-containing protein [Cryptosporidium muris RN66]